MRQLWFTDDASDNLVEIALYIASESQSRKIALAFVERLRAKCRHLASLPATLGTARPDLREDIRSTSCPSSAAFRSAAKWVYKVTSKSSQTIGTAP